MIFTLESAQEQASMRTMYKSKQQLRQRSRAEAVITISLALCGFHISTTKHVKHDIIENAK